MIAELAMIAAIAGLFSRKISQNGWMAFQKTKTDEKNDADGL